MRESLQVVYEDDFLMAVNKPPGMPVHPTGLYQRYAGGRVAYHAQQGSTRYGWHRLDKDTSGLVLVAKEPYTRERLIRQRAEGRLRREYLAIVVGRLPQPAGTITYPIGLIEGWGVRRGHDPQGKAAHTEYRVVRQGKDWSLVRVTLGTGRTHQIRVHMEAIGHPLVGDPMYGREAEGFSRQALHAWRLEFTHPRTGKGVRLRVPLPDDMLQLLKQENLMLM